jgi:integrase
VYADVTAISPKEGFMRVKADFSVFGRKLPSGKKVFYYQCYDAKGKRQWAKSTGKTKKTEAMAYCNRLFRDGLLTPEAKPPTFGEFSAGWWNVETCRYLKWRELHEPLSKSSVHMHKSNFDKYIKDYFAKFSIDEITSDMVEVWLIDLSKKIVKGNRGKKIMMKARTINMILVTFRLMMKEAVKRKIIKVDPCHGVTKLKTQEFEREILTIEEVKLLFPADWSTVWEDKVVYNAHRLAAVTGLRAGELLGLRGEYVFNDYLHICGQFTKYGYSTHTKTKHNRNVPITLLIKQELEELLLANGNGYVFSEDGGNTPVPISRLNRHFGKALKNIGISHEEKRRRNLSFHSWRHFLNTMLLTFNISESKVQKVTGHLTKK